MYRIVSLVMVGALFALAATLSAVESPTLVVAKFHADWCGSCKAMGEVEVDLQNKFDGKKVLFVTFDRTNASSSHQSELMASALGLKDVYAANAGTGYLLVLAADSKDQHARLTVQHDFKAMTAAIEEALSKK